MTTHEFLTQLTPHADLPLSFSTERARVEPGYHVTEIKAVTVDAMDCGGQRSRWSETVLQVWPSAGPSDVSPMSVGKFLGIYRRVAGAVAIEADAQVRVEYGAAGESAVNYLVTGVAVGDGGVDVRLAAPTVACKAADRSVGNIPVTGRFVSDLPVSGVAPDSGLQGCCAPVTGGQRA